LKKPKRLEKNKNIFSRNSEGTLGTFSMRF
jgi:hypothetical protein